MSNEDSLNKPKKEPVENTGGGWGMGGGGEADRIGLKKNTPCQKGGSLDNTRRTQQQNQLLGTKESCSRRKEQKMWMSSSQRHFVLEII